MINFKYDFAFLFKMIKYVFLPVLAVVVITAFIIFIYSRNVKKKDIKRYNYLVELWTTLLAMLIIGSLFAVTIGFAISFSNSIKMYNLVEGNEAIYYLAICSPLLPLLFLVIYIYRMIVIILSKPKKQKEIAKEDIVPEPNAIVEETNESGEEIKSEEDNDELLSPIVISEDDEDFKEDKPEKENTNKETIEVSEFTPSNESENYNDLDEEKLDKEQDTEVDKNNDEDKIEENKDNEENIEETEEEIELL